MDNKIVCPNCGALSKPSTVIDNGGKCWYCGKDLSKPPETDLPMTPTPSTTILDCCPDLPKKKN